MGTRPRASTSSVASLASLKNRLAEYSGPFKETFEGDHIQFALSGPIELPMKYDFILTFRFCCDDLKIQ